MAQRERPDQPIIDFEEKLKEPMLPDLGKAVEKAHKNFPNLIQRFGWGILLTFLIMYAAIGLNGLLIFLTGIIFIAVLQAALIFRYIVNENRRVKDHNETLEKEQAKALEDFEIVTDTEETKNLRGDRNSPGKNSKGTIFTL